MIIPEWLRPACKYSPERVEDLRQVQVGEAAWDLLGSDPKLPEIDDRAHRRPSALDDGLPTQDPWIRYHVAVLRQRGHGPPSSPHRCLTAPTGRQTGSAS